MKKTLLAIILTSLFSNTYAEEKKFDVSIGQQSSVSTGTITLSGTGGKGKQLPTLSSLPTASPSLEEITGEVKTEDVSPEIFKDLKEASNQILTFEGGRKGSNQKLARGLKPKADLTSPVPIVPKSSFSDLAKEIPIPTNFNILLDALSSAKHTMMPTSTAPVGLPEFAAYNAGVIDDNDLRKVLRNINSASKKAGSSLNLNTISTEQAETEKYEEIVLNAVEQKWYEPLKKEMQLMMLSGLPMKIMLVPSKDNVMFKFMINTIGKGKEDIVRFKKFDDGIFSLLGKPLINGRSVPMCYIVFDDLIDLYNKKILTPLENKIGIEATASLVVGHNVGICLDQLERENKLYKNNTWFSQDVYKIGLYSQSFQAIFPRGMKPSIYQIKENEIMSNNAQRQFQQRVADSFAALWAYNRGYKNSYNAFIDIKSYLPSYSTHNTAPAIKNLNQKLIQMRTNTLTLSKIWKLARENQKLSGVDSMTDYNVLYKPQQSELLQEKNETIAKNYIPTNKLGNNLSNTNHMNNTNNMANIKTTVADKKPLNAMNDFNKTKTQKFSAIHFNVSQMLKEGVEEEQVKNKTIKVLAKVEKPVKNVNVEEKQVDKAETESTTDIEKSINLTKSKTPTRFDEVNKGLSKETVNANKKEKVENKPEKVIERERLSEEKVRIKDRDRETLLKDFKFDLNSESDNLNFNLQ